MTETVVQMPLHVVLFRVQMNHARFKSLAVSGFSGHKKTKQEIDTLYQSPVPDLALMTGLTTRTLRNYLSQGFLHGEKANGIWQFTDAELDRFFADPFVKEGLRIKRSSAVFDFLADRNREKARSCVILDIPTSRKEGDKISAFFCDRMRDASDASFHYGWDNGLCRVILSGAADSVASIMHAYSITDFND